MKAVLLIGFAVIALGQPKDVYGWENVKWGMTVLQAANAVGGCEPESKHMRVTRWGSIISEGYPKPACVILEKPYPGNRSIELKGAYGEATVEVYPHSEKVSAIVVVPDVAPTWDDREKAYASLRADLIAKYGRLKGEERIDQAVWTFPSTTIKLSDAKNDGRDLDVVNVTYTPSHNIRR